MSDQAESVTAAAKPAPATSRLLVPAEQAVSAIVYALWIAICSAAPELLWQGIREANAKGAHFELMSALLFGLMSVFFIEPLLHRGRSLLEGAAHVEEAPRPWAPLYRFIVGFVFGLAAMFVHEAFNAFVAEEGGHADLGAEAGIVLTVSWAIAPFAIALAWQSRRRLWLGVPLGLVAAASSLIAGWLFDWSYESILTSTIPTLFVLALGYWRLRSTKGAPDFVRLVPMVAAVAIVWLAAAAAFDAMVGTDHSELAKFYDWDSVFVDGRFYIGWIIGLWLAPRPHAHAAHL